MSNCWSVFGKICLFICSGMISHHTTTEIQKQMVVHCTQLGKSTVKIAELAGCSECTIWEVLWPHRKIDSVHNMFAQHHGGPWSLNQHDILYISSLLGAKPTLYLDKLQIKLAETWHVDVSIATLSCAVHCLSITYKKVLKATMERNKCLQATWQVEYGDIPAVYLNESSVDEHTNQCTNGWALSGHACVCHAMLI